MGQGHSRREDRTAIIYWGLLVVLSDRFGSGDQRIPPTHQRFLPKLLKQRQQAFARFTLVLACVFGQDQLVFLWLARAVDRQRWAVVSGGPLPAQFANDSMDWPGIDPDPAAWALQLFCGSSWF